MEPGRTGYRAPIAADPASRPSRDGTPHPAALTENALRDDLGRPRRPGYTTRPEDIGPDDGVVAAGDDHRLEVGALAIPDEPPAVDVCREVQANRLRREQR